MGGAGPYFFFYFAMTLLQGYTWITESSRHYHVRRVCDGTKSVIIGLGVLPF